MQTAAARRQCRNDGSIGGVLTILEYPSARVGTVSEHRLETMNYVHDNSWLGKGESAQHLMPFVIWQRRTIDLIDFDDQETKLRVLPNSGQDGIYRADLSSSYLMYFILSYTYKIIIRKSFILSYTCYSYIHIVGFTKAQVSLCLARNQRPLCQG